MVITSSFKIVLKHLHNAHNPLRLGIVGIEFERALDIMRFRVEIEFWQPRRCANSPGIGGAIIRIGLNGLVEKGKVVRDGRANVARVGVGVVVKEGAPVPDVSTVDAFKRALVAAKTVAYIDPASGGSSGIYLTGLFEKLGVTSRTEAIRVATRRGLVRLD